MGDRKKDNRPVGWLEGRTRCGSSITAGAVCGRICTQPDQAQTKAVIFLVFSYNLTIKQTGETRCSTITMTCFRLFYLFSLPEIGGRRKKKEKKHGHT